MLSMFLKNLTLQEASEIAAQKNKELKIMAFYGALLPKKFKLLLMDFLYLSINMFSYKLLGHTYELVMG